MGDPKTVLEGCVKYRDKKKWKARWAVISKLSPVADCLHLQLYRDSKERCKNGPTKASLSLEAFLGLETGFTLDKESNTLALICSELVVVLAFDSRELLIQWQVKIKANLAEEQQFLVQITHVPPKSKLPCGPSRLHVQDYIFCLVSGVPPRLLATWPIKELRRFGVVEGKFCFEGGSLCGKGEGLHVLLTTQAEEVLQAMDLASKGKLLGKRKALSRKNSLLETSTRTVVQKQAQRIPDKCSTNDSCRPLLSSSSDTSSTCDACSEIILASDPLAAREDPTYNSCSAKASSCRIHYRWPSCMSRWGQSSTVTASDVESMDTVSVTLSDYQGPSHSSANSKASSHGASLLCLCEAQGTWPFNHCTKCGRQFYCRSSLGPSNGGRQRPLSPEIHDPEANNGFSPQWTMDAVLLSSNERNGINSKKSSTYQLALPTSDRASLCSHTSRSSSASTASSSGSEYSVPRNYLDNLYDKPRTLHSVREGQSFSNRTGVHNGNSGSFPQATSSERNTNNTRGIVVSEKEIVCPCHDPINEWVTAKDDQPKLACSCWNQLSLSVLGDKDVCGAITSSQRSVSANPSPSSSPKKVQKVNGNKPNSNASPGSSAQDLPCTCRRIANGSYMHYAVPRAALANMYIKEKQGLAVKSTEASRITENPTAAILSEDYDVPKKFAEILKGSDLALKSPLNNLENTPCTCNNLKVPVTNNLVPQPADAKSIHRYDPPATETVQMCTCQRLVLWAGSFVPCLGGPPPNVTDQGWQCTKGIGYPINNTRAVPNHYGTICCEPPRTAEVVLVNGKAKHILCGQAAKPDVNSSHLQFHAANGGKTRACSKPEEVTKNGEPVTAKEPTTTYVNIEFPREVSSLENPAPPEDPTVNYANLDFAQNLPLYENSNTVLTRLDQKEPKDPPTEKPTLPPRGIVSARCNIPSSRTNESMNIGNTEKQLQPEKSDVVKNPNNSIYELMNFEKPASTSYEDDYLMMQPVFHEKASTKSILKDAGIKSLKQLNQEAHGAGSDLPLRPFMPFSYPHFDSNEEETSSDQSKHFQQAVRRATETPSEVLTRRHHLINEETDLRSTRSNSLSELKKMVLLRKRSSSVDGKNNVSALDHVTKSNPASPIFSHKPSVQRKHSLFSKLNLRSKEKSMSTNEIIPLGMVPTSPNLMNMYRRNNLHRSADCLKLNEEYANSDDDLANESSDTLKETITMKRSSSVPCRSAMPGNFPSPRKTNVPVIPELNDLNKETRSDQNIPMDQEPKELAERDYCFENSDRTLETLDEGNSYCDNSSKRNCVNERYSDRLELQASYKRNRSTVDNVSILDPQRSATSSSSSDISDFIESLSHCSRSSSSSSSCNSDCIHIDELYQRSCTKLSNSSPHRINSPSHSKTNTCPHILVEDPPVRNAQCKQATKNSHFNEGYFGKSHHISKSNFSTNNPSPGHHINQESASHQCRDYSVSDSVTIPDSPFVTTSTVLSSTMVNGSRMRSCSRSPTSSTSSLSTSPSITDYSSSSSGNCCLPVTVTTKEDAINVEQQCVGNGPKMPANPVQMKHSMLCSKITKERVVSVDKGLNEGACSSTLSISEE